MYLDPATTQKLRKHLGQFRTLKILKAMDEFKKKKAKHAIRQAQNMYFD